MWVKSAMLNRVGQKAVHFVLVESVTMQSQSLRNISILVGLFLSKFDMAGLQALGLNGFSEAFNVIGFALGVQPASIKNYRDEFDPFFPNNRKGWHKRAMRANCKAILDEHRDLPLEEFSRLIKAAIYKDNDIGVLIDDAETASKDATSFAKRLVTGQAAENYFSLVHRNIELFKGFELEDTTRLGCGFDFRLISPETFYAVEVKGLNESSGNISMTQKEFSVASILRHRYFLFVVKNFREAPYHQLYCDPVNSSLSFEKNEQTVIQVSWSAKV